MSNLHEIKNRIGSVKSTKKITRAMYLISASKSQKAKGQLEATRPYFHGIEETLSEILVASGAVDTHFINNPVSSASKGCLYLVLGGDKGMAGGYNHNIVNFLKQRADKERDTLLVAGLLGRSQIRREGYQVDSDFTFPVMNPSVYRAREIAELLVERYLSRNYSAVHIVYTTMITPLKQEPVTLQLLPLIPERLPDMVPDNHTVKYEPSSKAVFDHLVPHYVKGVVYSAFVEAYTSEQSARMLAMDGATKSADDVIGAQSLRYNRARQALITQEITEIVGGIPTE